jgi:photosystem II stability/assembly factor-like uncharacterized protein
MRSSRVVLLAGLALACGIAFSEDIDAHLFSPLRWRLIGPFRGGRVTAVAGVSGDPNTFYFGTPGGGVWKSTNAGRTWRPIFDSVPVASIGAVSVAPSDPRTIYVGTGEQTSGNGVYKSSDGGSTWAHAGLVDTRFIQAIVVDPRNPNIAIAGANSLGAAIIWRPYPKSAGTIERGIFKTTDGGRSWKKVLTRDDTAGVVDMCADPSNAHVLYAVLYKTSSGTGASAVGSTSEIVKSTDAGSTWKPLAGKGLPEKDRGRMGISVAAGNRGRRLYAILNQGFFRSDDGGANWKKSTQDPRIVGSEYFSRVFADPQNPDLLYMAQTSLYRSTDGGHTFEPYVGAPSGDDFHVLWIDPTEPARLLLGVDQGAIVSVDAGASWSSWYNQPTGQFYHVSTDKAFPYRAYAAQQDSGTAGVLSRSDYGEITARDWLPIGGFEYCFIVADPANADIVYSGGWYGTVIRFDKKTGQPATIFERGEKYRTAQMAPLLFAPDDPHTLYMGTQFVMKTNDEGRTWQEISPDLTGYVEQKGEKADEDSAGKPPPPAIAALAMSTVQAGEIWAGTTNRMVQLTRNRGVSWQDVSPSGLEEPVRILGLEASHHDAGTAYLVAGATRQSTPPYIARTHDFGKTWRTIVTGLPAAEMARVVREDPVSAGLLYAGTDNGVYVSFNDGDRWQPLQLNLPAATINDLDVHDNDLVAATFGRALWILDDLSPLRLAHPDSVGLLQPEQAMRVRWDNNQDTPLPPETPAGQNPPDGAILNYVLKTAPAGEITLTILDARGNPVRRFSSDAKTPDLPLPNVPSYWFGPVPELPKKAGLNRFVWDLRYPDPQALPYAYSGNLLEYTEYTLADHAVPSDTPRQQPQGPLATPGDYTVELSVDGQTYRQPLVVKLDPRVPSSEADLSDQLAIAQQVTKAMSASYNQFKEVARFRAALAASKKAWQSGADREPVKSAINDFEKKLDAIDKGTRTAPGFGPINRDLTRLIAALDSADVRPSEAVRTAALGRVVALDEAEKRWRAFRDKDLPEFNAMLRAHELKELTAPK